MKKYEYVVLFILPFLFSCQSKKQSDSTAEYSLWHELLLGNEFIIGKIRGMALSNDSVLVVVNTQSDKVFQVLDYRKPEILEYGSRGQRPDDFLFPTSLSVMEDDKVAFWDINKRRYSTMRIASGDSIEQLHHLFQRSDSLFHLEILPVCNGRFIATGIYKEHRLILLDEGGAFLKGFGKYPYRDNEEKKVPDSIRSEVYQGKLAVNRSGTKLIQALLRADILSFYTIAENDNLQLITELIISYPDYQYDSETMELSTPIYYLDVCTTEQYVYILYSGRNYKDSKDNAFTGKTIRVYDWSDNLIRSLNLDVEVKVISVTSDDRKIYAISFQPDPVLVSFTLSLI